MQVQSRSHVCPPHLGNTAQGYVALLVLPALGILIWQWLWSHFDANVLRGIVNEVHQLVRILLHFAQFCV